MVKTGGAKGNGSPRSFPAERYASRPERVLRRYHGGALPDVHEWVCYIPIGVVPRRFAPSSLGFATGDEGVFSYSEEMDGTSAFSLDPPLQIY